MTKTKWSNKALLPVRLDLRTAEINWHKVVKNFLSSLLFLNKCNYLESLTSNANLVQYGEHWTEI